MDQAEPRNPDIAIIHINMKKLFMATSYLKINRWWWIFWFYSDHTGFHFWRRTEIILANLSEFRGENMFYLLSKLRSFVSKL